MSRLKITDLKFCETEATEDCNVVGGYNYNSYDGWSDPFFNDFFADSSSLEAPNNYVKTVTVSDSLTDSNGEVFASATKGKMNGRKFATSTSAANI